MMIITKERLILFLRLIFLLLIIIFGHNQLKSQIFTDQAAEMGVDALIQAHVWGAGVSVFDFNKDGLDDISLATNQFNHYFYQNNGNGFDLVDLNIPAIGGAAKQILWVDYDNDEDYDLLITYYFGKVRLYQNQGNMEFIDVTESAGLSAEITTNYGASFADVDRDGDLDLLICRYEDWLNPPNGPNVQPERWTRFYLNIGNGQFIDATESSGIIISPKPAFQSAFLDYDNDLWPDLHVIIDKNPGNHLFRNNEGIFSDLTEEMNISYPENDFMSNSVADFDNDGDLDIFMTNSNIQNHPPLLLQNNSGLSFSNITLSVGLEILDFAWGALWIDADNDGWQDLFFTIPYYESNYFFLNQEGVNFTDIIQEIEIEEDVPCWTVGKGDFNNDNRYDMAVQSVSPNLPLVLVNEYSQNDAIKITLEGTLSNKMAIGSWIKVYESDNAYHHYTMLGQNYISQNSQHLIFGLGETDQNVDSLTITYPSGHTDSYYQLPVDSHYYFIEGETYTSEILASDTIICEGSAAILDAGIHHSFLWNTGETSQIIEVDTSGVYSVEVANEFGISAFAEISIQVVPNPSIVSTISPNPCKGDSLASIALLNATGISADSVLWSNGDNGTFIDSLPEGIYNYNFIDINGCQVSGEIALTDAPELVVFANSLPSDPGANNGEVDITIFGGIAPYLIILDGDTVGPNITNLAPGDYEIIVIDSYGCEILVLATVESTLRTTDFETSSINLFPNPTEGLVEIKSDFIISKVEVRNILGSVQEIIEKKNITSILLSDQPKGVYILNLYDCQGNSYLRRIIKK